MKRTIYIWYEVSQGMKLEVESPEDVTEEELKEKALEYFYETKEDANFKVISEEDGYNPHIKEVYSIDVE